MTILSRIPLNAVLAVRDRYFAPIVLAPFADDMARRLARLSAGPLLEIAADIGALTQAIASAVSAGLTIIATDPAHDMIEHASSKPGMARVTWQQADPRMLPFPDETFGVVACHLGMAGESDRVGVLAEARRVMKPGGRFVFSTLGPLRSNPVADCLQSALDGFFPVDPPQFIANGLHGYADHQAIDDDLTTAGFTDAVYTTVELPFGATSAHDVAMGYCLGTQLRSELETRILGDTGPVLQAATRALTRRFGDFVVEAAMSANIISAAG